MSVLLLTVLVGFVATGLMTIAMYGIHVAGLANGDMIRAIGSYVTKRVEGALPLGLVLHIGFGIAFSFIYTAIISALELQTLSEYLLVSTMIGFAHGLVISFMIVIMVAEHHPIERYRQFGFPVALIHIVGHVVYGAALGAMLYYLGIRWVFIGGS